MIIQVYSSYNQLLIYIKSIKTTGLFLHFFLTFTLQYSLINSFHLKQLISQRGYNPLLPSLILSFFPLSLSLLKLYQGKWYHFHHFLLPSSSCLLQFQEKGTVYHRLCLLLPSSSLLQLQGDGTAFSHIVVGKAVGVLHEYTL